MASQLTHQVGLLYKSDAGTIASTQETFTGNAEENVNIDVPADNATTPLSVPLAVTVANITSMTLWSKLALSVKTYNGTNLVDTIALSGAKQLIYDTNMPTTAKIFTGDFTAFKLSNSDPTLVTQFRASILLTN